MRKYAIALSLIQIITAAQVPSSNEKTLATTPGTNTEIKTPTENKTLASTAEVTPAKDNAAQLDLPSTTDTSPAIDTWTVHEKPSPDSPSEVVAIKNWTIETADWYRITDVDTKKTYWIHQSELDKKNIQIHSSTKKTADSIQRRQALAYSGRNLIDEKSWEDFDKQFEEMIKLQNKYMKEMRKRTMEFFPSSFKTNRIKDIRYRFAKKIKQRKLII